MATPALLAEQMGPATESKLPLTREADAPSALAPAASRPRRPTRIDRQVLLAQIDRGVRCASARLRWVANGD
jgi:hypothetical protein